MSVKILAAFLSVSLVMLSLFSCAPDQYLEYRGIFERGFCADIRVNRDGAEYGASVSLTGVLPDDTAVARDATLEYTYPDAIVGLRAKRQDGVITLYVCDVEVVPSESIAKKYMLFADLLDVTASDITLIRRVEADGVQCYEMIYEHEASTYTALVTKNEKTPLYIKGEDIQITIDKFTYT